MKTFDFTIKPKKKQYESIQIDELWSYVGKKSNKKWLIYSYAPDTNEILAFVFGRRDAVTVRKLRSRIESLLITMKHWCTDDWNSFVKELKGLSHKIEKKFTTAIEGINCMIRHIISRLARKTCCFSKSFVNHTKTFQIILQGIHDGTVWSDYSPRNS